jgi:hypothetical protein
VLAKLGAMHDDLHAWDNNFLKKPKKRLRQVQRELETALSRPMNNENEILAKEKAALIELLLEQEEVHWLQRSRVNWLMQGGQEHLVFSSICDCQKEEESHN